MRTDQRRATACCVHRRHRGSVRLYSAHGAGVLPLPGPRLRTPDLLLRPTTEADLPAVAATLSADIATNPQLPRFPGWASAPAARYPPTSPTGSHLAIWSVNNWRLDFVVVVGERIIGDAVARR